MMQAFCVTRETAKNCDESFIHKTKDTLGASVTKDFCFFLDYNESKKYFCSFYCKLRKAFSFYDKHTELKQKGENTCLLCKAMPLNSLGRLLLLYLPSVSINTSNCSCRTRFQVNLQKCSLNFCRRKFNPFRARFHKPFTHD